MATGCMYACMCEGLLIGSLGVEFQLSYPRLISAPLVSTPLASTRLVSIQLVSAHESKTYWKLGVHSGVSQGNSSCMALALKSSYAIEPTKPAVQRSQQSQRLNKATIENRATLNKRQERRIQKQTKIEHIKDANKNAMRNLNHRNSGTEGAIWKTRPNIHAKTVAHETGKHNVETR